MPEIPEDLKYTADHEWVRLGNDSTVRVGITEFAAEQLGDIVYAVLPEVGSELSVGNAAGELESTKSVSDIMSPVDGVVSAVNDLLADAPETVNASCYGDGWLFEVGLSAEANLDDLLDADAYAAVTGA